METDELEDMPLTANAPVLFYSDRRELGLARGLDTVPRASTYKTLKVWDAGTPARPIPHLAQT